MEGESNVLSQIMRFRLRHEASTSPQYRWHMAKQLFAVSRCVSLLLMIVRLVAVTSKA
jgi:hypothetical protein